jgi:hypothetical protein
MPWTAELQVKERHEGGFEGVRSQHGTQAFPPGDTTLSGDICYNFADDATRIRVEFFLGQDDQARNTGTTGTAGGSTVEGEVTNDNEHECNPHKKSPAITPCDHNGSSPHTFMDMGTNNPFYTAVMSLQDKGIVSGYADGTFRPYNQVTRGQVAKMMVLAFHLPLMVGDGQRFSDVPADEVFASYIETAYTHNLVSGYADGTFRPANNVTRGQLAKIIVEAAGIKLANPAAPGYSDVPIDSTFYRYIETARANGMMSGYPDGTFRAGAEANRGQVSKVVMLAAFPPQE